DSNGLPFNAARYEVLFILWIDTNGLLCPHCPSWHSFASIIKALHALICVIRWGLDSIIRQDTFMPFPGCKVYRLLAHSLTSRFLPRCPPRRGRFFIHSSMLAASKSHMGPICRAMISPSLCLRISQLPLML